MRFLTFLFPALLCAQITRVQTTHTQAVVDFTAPSAAACTISLSPANADVDVTLFGGANSDLARASTVTTGPSGIYRTIVIGARAVATATNGRRYSRALRSETAYTLTVCGSMTASFITRAPGQGDITPEAPVGWPTIDATDAAREYIDPLTGVPFRILDRAGDAGANTRDATLAFGAVTGGAGWTSLQNVITAGASSATTTNTNSVTLYPDPSIAGSFFFSGWLPRYTIEDLAAYVTAGGDSATASDREYGLCLTADDGATCLGSELTRTAAQGAPALTISPSPPFSAMFAGWGSPLVARELMPSFSGFYGGSVSCTAGACTITGPGYLTRLAQPTLTRIRIAGSSPTCANNVCTVTARTNSTTFTLAESLTIASAQFYTLSLGVRLRKLNSTGTLTVSAGYRAAGRQPAGLRAESNTCSRNTFVTGDAKVARLCLIQLTNSASISLYAITADGESRYLSSGSIGRTCCAPTAPSAAASNSLGFVADFDPVDAKRFYVVMNNNAGNRILWRVDYTGTGTRLDYAYGGGPGGDFPNTDDLLAYTAVSNLTTSLAGISHYSVATYGGASSFTLAPTIAGSGDLIALSNAYQGGLADAGACWLMAINRSTGAIVKMVHTLDGFDGSSYIPDLRGGTCHSWSAIQYPTGALVASQNHMRSNSANRNSGPFTMPITGVMRSGSFSTNTAIPYPPDATYDRACGTVADEYVTLGATGNNCVTVRTSATSYVSIAPGPADPLGIRLGDVMADYDQTLSVGDMDVEQFRVVAGPVDLGGGSFQYTLQRQAFNDYCIWAPGLNARFTHNTGWRPYIKPGPKFGCSSTLVFALNNMTQWEPTARNAGVGHWGVGNPFSGTIRYVTAFGITDGGFADLQTPQWAAKNVFAISGFAGLAASAVPTQGYPNAGQYDAATRERLRIVDTHSYLPSAGCGTETGCDIGASTQTLQVGTTSVYKLSILGTGDYKRGALIVWAGRRLLGEKSGPTLGNTLTDSDTYQFCFAIRAGECRTGALAGDLYAVVPRADLTGRCVVGDSSLASPCAMWAHPYGGFMVTRSDAGDANGNGGGLQKILWPGGGHNWGYSKLQLTPDGKFGIGHMGAWSDQSTHGILTRIPGPGGDGIDRSGFRAVAVTGLPAGSKIRFGYTPDFRCTGRAEACEVSAATITNSNAYGFSYEAIAGSAAGGSITIPAKSQRILFYSVNGGPATVVAVR
jgi:hypothetical protein